jgi:hypothetical protein
VEVEVLQLVVVEEEVVEVVEVVLLGGLVEVVLLGGLVEVVLLAGLVEQQA